MAGLAAARWLSGRLIDHRLAKDLLAYRTHIDRDLASFRSELDARVAAAGAELAAKLRQDVESYLADRSVERQYAFEARKRLYAAIGPLRVQLLSASADLVARVIGMGRGQERFRVTLDTYFGRSTAYRLIKIFALLELVERQMAYADFSGEPTVSVLLKLKRAAYRAMCSGKIVLEHPQAHWDEQTSTHISRHALGSGIRSNRR